MTTMRERIYLDNAATTLVDSRVLNVATDFANMLRDTTLSTSDVTRLQRQSLNSARQAVASFIHCHSEEVALMQCTSHALGTLVNCLPLKKGDNILICDLEYQASTICWHPRMEHVGFEVRQVKSSNGQITADDFERHIDSHTRVILLAAVQEINGFRADVQEIGRVAQAHECYYIVDGIQEVGALKVDVQEIGADFYCAGGKKWLGNPFGTGFLYIRRDHLKTLEPAYYSYFDIQVPNHYKDYLTYLEDPRRHPFDQYKVNRDASTFEIGGYGNYIGALGLSKAIDVLNEYGIDAIEAKNKRLAQKMYDGLEAMGLCLASSPEYRHRSSIISFSFDGLKENNVDRERRFVDHLLTKNIYVSLRCSTGTGGVRVSVHHYTPESYVDIFLEETQRYLKNA